jgi:hypothetical protein
MRANTNACCGVTSVEAEPTAKLPPGATEAEFAYLKAKAIKDGDDHEVFYGATRDDEVLIPGVQQKVARWKLLRRARTKSKRK